MPENKKGSQMRAFNDCKKCPNREPNRRGNHEIIMAQNI
jgi:hypothetical protein